MGSESQPLTADRLSPDDVLERLGTKCPRLIVAVVLAGLTWSATAIIGMNAAFVTRTCQNCSDMQSLADEFKLGEGDSYLADMTTTAFMIGNMVGGTIVSQGADRYGRRPVLLFCLIMMALTGPLSAISPSILIFSILRFFQGVFYTGGALVSWVLGYECTPVNLRFVTSLFAGMCWVLGYCLVVPLAYLSPNWRWLVLASTTPHLILAIFCYFFAPESLHYLVSKGKTSEIDIWLSKSKGNRTDTSVAEISAENIVHNKQNNETACHLIHEVWKHKRFILYLAVLICILICDTFIYFGLSLYSTHLAGNIYLNYLFMGLVEVPAYILSPIGMNKIGRRFVVSGAHFLAAIAFFGLLLAPTNSTISLILWLTGKFTISCSFMGIYVYASEIFPTNSRNLCLGFCETLSRIGGILAPQIATLGRISISLPMIVLAGISLASGVVACLLPETKGRQLPSTIAESVQKESKK